ncbi:hypothetical protein Goshw_024963 [Gossypium schwendimanii]|uniref:Uncharacterized protein n=1 Tax=Gossypium schwendimanii TaxID=34291 RepID=A0A7J9MJU5_GOSSC|nr:hypothetical protein [Gossypium schwendimanii]
MVDFDVSDSDGFVNDVADSDVFNKIRVNLDGLNMDDIEIGELCDSDDSERLDSAHESDSNGQNWPECNLDNDMSNPKLHVTLEARGKPILTMMETIRTNIMLLIVKKKEEAKKIKGILCPKIKKKLDVNIKDSLRCVPSHADEDNY